MENTQKLTVFYDGSCPVCSREIAFYKRQAGAENMDWFNLHDARTDEVAPGLTKQTALARFHVLTAEGEIVSGARAFSAIWSGLPRFRALAVMSGVPPVPWLLERAYTGFLRIRRALKR